MRMGDVVATVEVSTMRQNTRSSLCGRHAALHACRHDNMLQRGIGTSNSTPDQEALVIPPGAIGNTIGNSIGNTIGNTIGKFIKLINT